MTRDPRGAKGKAIQKKENAKVFYRWTRHLTNDFCMGSKIRRKERMERYSSKKCTSAPPAVHSCRYS